MGADSRAAPQGRPPATEWGCGLYRARTGSAIATRGRDGARSSLKAISAVTGSPDCGGRRQSRAAAVSWRLFPSSSIMPSGVCGCVRAPPRAPRAAQGARRPGGDAGAVRDLRWASGSPGPARPGAALTRSLAASLRPARPPRPRRRGRCPTALGGRCPPTDPPTARGRPHVGSSHRGRHREEARPLPGRQRWRMPCRGPSSTVSHPSFERVSAMSASASRIRRWNC